jgi:hypothetical protein
MTPFGRKGEAIGAPSRRIEELAAQNVGSLAPKFGSFCSGQAMEILPMTVPAARRSVDGEYDRGIMLAVRRATAAIADKIRFALEPYQRVSG